jgi:probable F420-dependent oxidoreductase
MTDEVSLKPDLGRFGVWTGYAIPPEQTVEIEKLGYGAVWLGGSPPSDLSIVEPILERTETLQVATGVVNIWSAPANQIAESYHRIEQAYPGRFLLGIGVGHSERTDEYRKPYDALVEYLDALDTAEVPTNRLVIGALGPRVLKLSAARSAGAHPYLTTPGHTSQARELVGDSVYLAPEHTVLLSTDAGAARELGRETVGLYMNLGNYVNNWRRLGFTEADVTKPGSDKLVDSVIAHGTAEQIVQKLNEHIDAGADHVAVQVLGGADALIPTLAALATRWG